MLPLISEEARETVLNEVFQDVNAWRKEMIHYLKEKNPEVNTAIIESANKSGLEPKAIALGAYMIYKMLEVSEEGENQFLEDFISQ